ncbi:putative ATP-dependent endonuclease of the OLD family [Eubacterium pyruvativorans]|uniref:Putative ATP-dependent endonuclease of the OLD family n=1 Tax=Eubacterium pyruvativorans TaxID=155865 RepID=A0A1I7I1N9_9FIRM|nr:AAA family ATPase [Eubacterium pyruvativorans]SFO36300.1 putative ATP-dependent endonuclease of the OLD family [Eubacterium pyruvativorans]SFU66854.1 putative ATP-dependent endonuclease of the OLD family [Eubacterium pyruvativorans]
MIKKLLVRNYKILKDLRLELNPRINIFVGDNDAGKSTLLEALSIVTTGKLHYYPFERQIKANLFSIEARNDYIKAINSGQKPEPPQIIMEAYFDKTEDQHHCGTNNELHEDCPGIRVVVEMDSAYTEVYKKMLAEKSIFDIPVELYKVTYHYFSSEEERVLFRFSSFKSVFIDATHRDYSYVINRFVSSNIEDILTNEEQVELSWEYRSNRDSFRKNEYVKKLNESVSQRNEYNNKKVSIDLTEDHIDAWKKEMNLVVEDIPFENVGFGTQNTIKSELALKNSSEKVKIILIEEPENNLSYANMARLIENISSTDEKQVFVATHSSYVANKLDLQNLFLIEKGKVVSFKSLSAEAVNYFVKLPGYDTLRVLLAEKVILVEGPTDELILQRAYNDRYGRLPIQDGVDIIAVGSLSFNHYCEIAGLINKEISVVTDNDHSISKMKKKYEKYIEEPFVSFFYEKNEELNTIEPSVLEANCVNKVPDPSFQGIVYHGSKKQMTFDELNDFMERNKSLWAMRVFEAEENIQYPEYIQNAVRQFDKN